MVEMRAIIDPILPKGLRETQNEHGDLPSTSNHSRLVSQSRSLVVLVLHCASESNVRDEEHDPDESTVEGDLQMQRGGSVNRQKACSVDAYQGREVSEDRQRRIGDANVGQRQEQYTCEEGVDWNTSLVDPLEDRGRLPLNRKLEQGSRTNVDIRIGC